MNLRKTTATILFWLFSMGSLCQAWIPSFSVASSQRIMSISKPMPITASTQRIKSRTCLCAFQWPKLFTTVPPKKPKEDYTDRVLDVLESARQIGPVGALRSQDEQDVLLEKALNLRDYSDANPAKIPLEGLHSLVYSAAPGGSSGKVGPFVGKVTQQFLNDEIFINAVELGPLKIALTARREIKSNCVIQVYFQKTTVKLFGQTITEKEAGGGGTWKYIFAGTVQDGSGKKLIRIMQTPSLFVLETPLAEE